MCLVILFISDYFPCFIYYTKYQFSVCMFVLSLDMSDVFFHEKSKYCDDTQTCLHFPKINFCKIWNQTIFCIKNINKSIFSVPPSPRWCAWVLCRDLCYQHQEQGEDRSQGEETPGDFCLVCLTRPSWQGLRWRDAEGETRGRMRKQWG